MNLIRDLLESNGVEYLYHMTHINNFESIVSNGLFSHNAAYKRGIIKNDISDSDVQNKRKNVIDPCYKRNLHDYASLYFSPRNPMLYKRKEIQEDIIILGVDIEVLFQARTVFTDGNAASPKTKFYKDSDMLSQLPWSTIMAKSWNDLQDGRRIKCAETLIYPRIRIEEIKYVFCYSDKHRDTLVSIKQGTHILGKKNPSLYFPDTL
jgi:ssDNA thymidine ADP-ribosyltransferase, DarT